MTYSIALLLLQESSAWPEAAMHEASCMLELKTVEAKKSVSIVESECRLTERLVEKHGVE